MEKLTVSVRTTETGTSKHISQLSFSLQLFYLILLFYFWINRLRKVKTKYLPYIQQFQCQHMPLETHISKELNVSTFPKGF